MRFIFLIGISFLLAVDTFSQVRVLNESDLFENSNSHIDIKIINNNILVPIDLNHGLKVYFILDTGVKTTIITEPLIANFLQLPLERKISIKGYGAQEPIPAWVSTKLNYRLNEKYEFKNQDVIVLENAVNLDQFLGEAVYGIIGYDFLSQHQVTIDYKRERIYIKSPSNEKKIERLRRKKRVKVFDLDFKGSKAFITAVVNHSSQTDSLKLLVDTGFSGALSLFPNKKTEEYIEPPIIDHYQGYGMNGLILSQFKKLDYVKFSNKICMNDVSTLFIDSLSLINVSHHEYSDGSIGNDILKRFIVSFDYDNNKMYLKPLRSRLKEDFYYNRTGISLLYHPDEEGKKYVIQSIRKGSNAQNSGLKELDVLISIDGKKTKNMSMSKVYEELNHDDDKQKVLVVKRENKELSFNFNINTIAEWN